MGIDVEWDFLHYNKYDNTITGRFSVSLAHQNPKERKTIEDLDKYIESLGRYVISDNSKHIGFEKANEFGQKTVSYMDHPYNKNVPNEIDIHLPVKERELTKTITLEELTDINKTIIDNASKFPELKKFRDSRFKPRDVGKGYGKKYQIYTAMLEEIT